MNRVWWKESVVYQIYVRSFKDSNGDGIGDLRGIIEKLDYLKELGIDVIWLTPIYSSPNDDNGYDISDYYNIMTEFGDMEDFDELLTSAHDRSIKIVMDLVVNHTSDAHAWFVESRKSKETPYRDYYIWRQGNGNEPPNNWESFFSGSAWELDPATGEYYLHLYASSQPDLNWENDAVVNEIHAMVKWWLDKGIDGFRVDAIGHIAKAPGLPDDSGSDRTRPRGYTLYSNLPKVHTLLRDLNDKVISRYDVMTVGETSGVNPEKALLYVAEDRHEFNMVFQFEHMWMDYGPKGKWDVSSWSVQQLKEIITRWQAELHGRGWNANYLNNHDQPRAVSRFGDDKKYRVESSKMLATLVHTLEGTPYIYQGEEIGMTNVAFENVEEYRDVQVKNMWREQVLSGDRDPRDALKAVWYRARDNARTPMQWDTSNHAGFTTGEPWIRVNSNYSYINVESVLQDPNSVFYYYQRLIWLRKHHSVIVYGKYDLLYETHPDVFAYTRTLENERVLVILNFSANEPIFELPKDISYKSKLLISNYEVGEQDPIESFPLRPYEARVYLLHQ